MTVIAKCDIGHKLIDNKKIRLDVGSAKCWHENAPYNYWPARKDSSHALSLFIYCVFILTLVNDNHINGFSIFSHHIAVN